MKRNNGTTAEFNKIKVVKPMKGKFPVDIIGIVVAVLVIDIAVSVMFWYACKTLIEMG